MIKTLKQGTNIEVTNNASDITIAATGVAQSSHTHNAADINAGTLATARLGSGTPDSIAFLRKAIRRGPYLLAAELAQPGRALQRNGTSQAQRQTSEPLSQTFTLTNSDGKSVQIDTNGKTQVRLMVFWNKIGTGTHSVQVLEVGTSTCLSLWMK